MWIVRVLSCGLSFSGLELDHLVTQSPKWATTQRDFKPVPFKYTVVKCQYKLLSLQFIVQLHFMNQHLYIKSMKLCSITSPLTPSYNQLASFIPRLALHWQHRLGLSMGCQHSPLCPGLMPPPTLLQNVIYELSVYKIFNLNMNWRVLPSLT